MDDLNHARHPPSSMNFVKNCPFFKTSASSAKLIFDYSERLVFALLEGWIGEHMGMGCEWISGIYGKKPGTITIHHLCAPSLLKSDAHSISCFRSISIEISPDIRLICKVRRLVEAKYECI